MLFWTPVRLCALAAICAVLNMLAIRGWDTSHIANDGVQYLSTAANWLAGNGFSTNALIYTPHFQGVIPAPQTVWPPGYSLVVALVSLTGLEIHWAALFVNICTHALAAYLVFLILRRMAVSTNHSTFGALMFYVMAMPWSFVTGIITEPLFTTLLLAALLQLPDPERYTVSNWIICGILMALAIHVRYSAVFFAAGAGAGIFIYIVLFQFRRSSLWLTSVLKLVLMMSLPVLMFVYLMYRTSALIGTLDRYSGTREPETLQSTLWSWVTNSSELLGFADGNFFSYSVGVALFAIFTALVISLVGYFLLRVSHRVRTVTSSSNIAFIRLVSLVIMGHSLALFVYLSMSSMSETPLIIINRYLYQIYGGLYILLCFMLHHILLKQKSSGQQGYPALLVLSLTGLIGIYLAAQINELSSTRTQFFAEARTSHEVLQLPVTEHTSLAGHIRTCFSDKPEAALWSTHGQHIHLHTEVPTITHADIYTSQPFEAKRLVKKIDTYDLKMFIFIGDEQHTDPAYSAYMLAVKQWLSQQKYQPLALEQAQVSNGKTVQIFTEPTTCSTRS